MRFFLVAVGLALAIAHLNAQPARAQSCMSNTLGSFTFTNCSNGTAFTTTQLGNMAFTHSSTGLDATTTRLGNSTYTNFSNGLSAASTQLDSFGYTYFSNGVTGTSTTIGPFTYTHYSDGASITTNSLGGLTNYTVNSPSYQVPTYTAPSYGAASYSTPSYVGVAPYTAPGYTAPASTAPSYGVASYNTPGSAGPSPISASTASAAGSVTSYSLVSFAGSVVGLQGTPHIWIIGDDGLLHWAGDTRALDGRAVRWSSRADLSLAQLRNLPRGNPWLSTGLLKDGDAIYLVKWETGAASPVLLHIRSIGDLELFGINASNYGAMVIDRMTWERRFGISAARLPRAELASTR